jgi:hypothetical protein
MNLMGQGPSWLDGGCCTFQQICRPLWKSKVHYRVHKTLSLILVESRINQFYILLHQLFELILYYAPSTHSPPSGLLLSDLPPNLLLFLRWIFSLHFRNRRVNFSYKTPDGTCHSYTNPYPQLGQEFICIVCFQQTAVK